MKPRHRVSQGAIGLIKQFEGYRRSAAQLADGRWTIGYGHVKFAREGAEVTEKDAEALLIYDLIEVTGAVNDLVFTPLNQNQFDALTSFAFNVGLDAFRTSEVLRRLNEGDLHGAAWAIETWRRSEFGGAPIVVDALIRRRAAEKALFLTPQDGFVPAPTPVVPPQFDPESIAPFPARDPRSLVAPLEGAVATVFEAPKPDEGTQSFPTVDETVEAVTSRLREIVPAAPEGTEVAAEPENPAEGPGELVADVPETPEGPGGVLHVERAREPAKSLAPLFLLSLSGVAAFGFAVYWRLLGGRSEEGAANAQAISYLIGIIGVILIFIAAYKILERLASDDR